jgi:hypothetical protein
MFTINFPNYNFKLKEDNGKKYVFDIVRKQYIFITPEEWVRQHLLYFLIEDLQYPKSFISVEHSISLNGLKKRCDIVVFNKFHAPAFIIECKKPEFNLNQTVFDQAGRYNLELKVPFLAISNGNQNIVSVIDKEKKVFRFLNNFPNYNDLDYLFNL